MSDIRFNQWLHNSGTGGVSQVDGGHVGIGTTNPLIPVGAGVTAVLNVGVVTANSYYGSGANLTGIVGSATSLSFNDNIGAYWGNTQDLKIHHDGNHSYIDDQGTGNLRLRSGTLEITNLASNKTSALFSSGGGQTLNFNNNTKFVTTNTGVVVTGVLTATSRLGVGNDGTPWGATGNVNTGVRLVNSDSSYAISANSKDIVAILNRTNSGGVITEYKYNGNVVGNVITDGTNIELHASANNKISAGGGERLRIASDGSIYGGGTIITESDLNWGHDTYQRPHIFSGITGGSPADGAIVSASAAENPSDARIGAFIFGCKTSSSTGVSNSGLKAYIECYTNTNVSDAWKTGGYLKFSTRPDNGNPTERVRIDSSGHVLPATNNTYDLGSTSLGWRNVYMNDLNLSNMKGNTNDVDGTQGSWTIQEGKDDLYIINRLNGKKFKIKMEEIS